MHHVPYVMNILIIDDDKETSKELSEFFDSKGIPTIISHDPIEGLNFIRQEKFDLILLNVSMKVIRGIGVIELLASDDILKDQNIFIFSEEDFPEIQVKNMLRRDGVNAYFKKPIDPVKILPQLSSDLISDVPEVK